MRAGEEENYRDSVGLSDLFIVMNTDGDSDSEKAFVWICAQPTHPRGLMGTHESTLCS